MPRSTVRVPGTFKSCFIIPDVATKYSKLVIVCISAARCYYCFELIPLDTVITEIVENICYPYSAHDWVIPGKAGKILCIKELS